MKDISIGMMDIFRYFTLALKTTEAANKIGKGERNKAISDCTAPNQ